MTRLSAGTVIHRLLAGKTQVLLVHPGGPFWKNRDLGSWSIPKGEYDETEDPECAARRELFEETGARTSAPLIPLGSVRQSRAKVVTAFALSADIDVANIRSNLFEMEWPPRSGLRQAFPEIDRAEWFDLPVAREKIVAGQLPFLDRLEAIGIADSLNVALVTRVE